MTSSLKRYLRAFGPSVALAAVSVLALLKLLSAAQTHLIAPVVETMAWLPLAACVLAAGWAFASAIRLLRWQTGCGPPASTAGGARRRAGGAGRPPGVSNVL